MSELLPPPDRTKFPVLDETHIETLNGLMLGRIYQTAGDYAKNWNTFRLYGPTSCRFDHQDPDAANHASRSVLYSASTVLLEKSNTRNPLLRTCLAEVFGSTSVIDLTVGNPYFVQFSAIRPLRLLDLADSDWVLLAGANALISGGPHPVCQEWAKAIYEHYAGDDALDGLWYACSSNPPARTVVLFDRAEDALPAHPASNLALSMAALVPALKRFSTQLHYSVLR